MLAFTLIFYVFALINFTLHCAEQRQASEVFNKWTTWQKIIPDCNLTQIGEPKERTAAIKTCYEQNLTKLRSVTNFLDQLSEGSINDHGYQIGAQLSQQFEQNLAQLNVSAQNDISLFLQLLKGHQFSNIDQASVTEQINTYNALMAFIFAHENEEKHHDFLFALANQFFEFCFSSLASTTLHQMLFTKQHQALIRMMYAVIWEKLAGAGWKHWHENSLKALKQEYDAGKTVLYLAGGSDIYQLITHGIYSIHIVDPQLPTQPKYYADQWDWLIKNSTQINGGLGDRIIFNGHKLVMQRSFFQETGNHFSMTLSNGSCIQIAQSVTQWDILNLNGEIIGRVIFERRPVCQDDFISYPHNITLMSFNELYFIALPKNLGGWGVEPAQFPDNFNMIIKQLKKPVTKSTICSMRTASLLNASDLKFIDLGTCVN